MVMRKLIPSDIDIYEQFRHRNRIVGMINKWATSAPTSKSALLGDKIHLEQLRNDSGIRCWYVGRNLAGFELEDEKMYSLFLIKWS